MNKHAISSLAVLVAVASFAAPALASSLTGPDLSSENYNEDIVLQQLKARGIEVTELSDWNGIIRATVTLDDGSSTFQYFEIGLLNQVSPSGQSQGNVRVLSERDVGPVPAKALALDSLASDESDDD